MTRWRSGHDARILLDVEKLVEQSKAVLANEGGAKQHRRNQHGPPRNMISQIHKEVEATAAKLKRTRQLPHQTRPGKLRVFLFYEQCMTRAAKLAEPGTWSMDRWREFRKKIKRQWGSLSREAQAQWERTLTAARAARPLKQRAAGPTALANECAQQFAPWAQRCGR